MIISIYVDDRFYGLVDAHVAPGGIVSHPFPMAVVCGVYFPLNGFGNPAAHPTVRMSSRMAAIVGLPQEEVHAHGA